jgi:DNA-binding MarR family transcriptional regulator
VGTPPDMQQVKLSRTESCIKWVRSKQLQFGPISITEKQLAILSLLCEAMRTKGCPPTRQEIAEQYGCSRSGIQSHLRALEAKGLVRMDSGDRRTVPLVRVMWDGDTACVVWEPVDKSNSVV